MAPRTIVPPRTCGDGGARPALIWAHRQTHGRGRGAHRWHTGEGALAFSLCIDPLHWDLPQERWPTLSLITCMAVAEASAEQIPASALGWKWPNDVALASGKVAGILLEIPPSPPRAVVVGIGVNLNNNVAAVPAPDAIDAWLPYPASLRDALGHPLEAATFVRTFLTRFFALVTESQRQPQRLPERWAERCLLTGHHVRLRQGSRTLEGQVLGITLEGHLRLATPEGEQTFAAGTIHRPAAGHSGLR